jgi:hypothetical protein
MASDMAHDLTIDTSLVVNPPAPTSVSEKPRPLRRGREARRAARVANNAVSAPYFVRNIAPLEVLNEEALCIIEANADRILQDVGIEVRGYPRAKQLFSEAGCDVQGDRVRFPVGLSRARCVARAPVNLRNTLATQPAPAKSAATTRSSRPFMGRRSCMILIKAAAMARLRISEIS